MKIKPVEQSDYDIPMVGHPALHRNLCWYATDNDAVLGVVVLDLVDHDFSWVMLTENEQGPGYTAVDIGTSLPSQDAAADALFVAMMKGATS